MNSKPYSDVTDQDDDKIKAYAMFPQSQRRIEWITGNKAYYNGLYYETPIPRYNLAKALDTMPHHDSALEAKHNILMTTMLPTNERVLSYETLDRLAWDYLIYGDFFTHAHKNRLGGLHHYEHLPSLHSRKTKIQVVLIEDGLITHKYKKDDVLHTMRYDGRQEMYGRPGYLAALLSVFLGHAATKSRYYYVKNRSNTGFILYVTGQLAEGVVDEIEDALAGGDDDQFGNVVIHDAGGHAGANTGKKIELIPISDKNQKDDYPEVKQTTFEDVLAAHRVPPQLMGIMPKNTGGFGSALDAAKVFARNEIQPLHRKFKQINQHAGQELIKFEKYTLED